nr:hypothetical protein CFP56_19086 [Quercus suber]
MDQATKSKENVKELKDTLKVEKKLAIQKDEEVQAALLKTDEESIDTKIFAGETKEKEDETVADTIEGDGTTAVGIANEAHMDEGHIEEVVTAP